MMTTVSPTSGRHAGRWPLIGGLVLVLLAGAAVVPGVAAPAGGQQIAFEDVIGNLKSGDPRVKIDALQMLAKAGYLEASGPIIPLIGDSVAEVQVAAIDTLLGLFLVDEDYTRKYGQSIVHDKKASLPLLAFTLHSGQLVANTFPPEVIKGLVGALNSPVAEVRYNAAYALGVFGPTAARRGTVPDGRLAVERLGAMVKDPNPLMRLVSTQVMGRLFEAAARNPRANTEMLARRVELGDAVIAGINDTDEFVKQASLKAVGDMGLERSVQSLIDMASYYGTGVLALQAYDSLARIAHPGSLSMFSQALHAKDDRIRAYAVAGIGRMADKRAIYDMETRVAKDKSKRVKLALAFSRARNGDLSQIVTVAEGFKIAALSPAAFDYLLDLGPSVADALAPVAAHRDASVRAGVAELLGLVGNEQSVFVVQSLSRDKNGQVSAAGVRSAKRLSPRPANAPRLM
jgi:HEAT repeat protein